MKQNYFRIIELPEHDVLLQKDWDEDEDSPQVTITVYINGVRAAAKLGYKTEEERDKAFDIITDAEAQGMVNDFVKMLT